MAPKSSLLIKHSLLHKKLSDFYSLSHDLAVDTSLQHQSFEDKLAFLFRQSPLRAVQLLSHFALFALLTLQFFPHKLFYQLRSSFFRWSLYILAVANCIDIVSNLQPYQPNDLENQETIIKNIDVSIQNIMRSQPSLTTMFCIVLSVIFPRIYHSSLHKIPIPFISSVHCLILAQILPSISIVLAIALVPTLYQSYLPQVQSWWGVTQTADKEEDINDDNNEDKKFKNNENNVTDNNEKVGDASSQIFRFVHTMQQFGDLFFLFATVILSQGMMRKTPENFLSFLKTIFTFCIMLQVSSLAVHELTSSSDSIFFSILNVFKEVYNSNINGDKLHDENNGKYKRRKTIFKSFFSRAKSALSFAVNSWELEVLTGDDDENEGVLKTKLKRQKKNRQKNKKKMLLKKRNALSKKRKLNKDIQNIDKQDIHISTADISVNSSIAIGDSVENVWKAIEKDKNETEVDVNASLCIFENADIVDDDIYSNDTNIGESNRPTEIEIGDGNSSADNIVNADNSDNEDDFYYTEEVENIPNDDDNISGTEDIASEIINTLAEQEVQDDILIEQDAIVSVSLEKEPDRKEKEETVDISKDVDTNPNPSKKTNKDDIVDHTFREDKEQGEEKAVSTDNEEEEFFYAVETDTEANINDWNNNNGNNNIPNEVDHSSDKNDEDVRSDKDVEEAISGEEEYEYEYEYEDNDAGNSTDDDAHQKNMENKKENHCGDYHNDDSHDMENKVVSNLPEMDEPMLPPMLFLDEE